MSLFDAVAGILASNLLNRELELPNGQVVTIIETNHYTREENAKGSYAPILDMDPSRVFSPRIMGHPMFLIACWDRVSGEDVLGGCVRISAIDTDTHGVISGAGRVGRAVGFTQHKQMGQVTERQGAPLLLSIIGVVKPDIVLSGAVKLSARVMAKYMEPLTHRYLQDGGKFSMVDWMEKLEDEHKTEPALRTYLGLED